MIREFILMILVFLAFMIWEKAQGHPYQPHVTVIQSGQCIDVGSRRICAQSQIQAPQVPVLQVQQPTIDSTDRYCSLEKHGSGPAKWVLKKTVTLSNGRSKTVVLKAFAHFERSECESKATL